MSIEEIKEQNKKFVELMVKEIKYICDEALDHDHSYVEMKASIMNRMYIEENLNSLLKEGK